MMAGVLKVGVVKSTFLLGHKLNGIRVCVRRETVCILEVKNAFIKSVCCVTERTVCSSPHPSNS